MSTTDLHLRKPQTYIAKSSITHILLVHEANKADVNDAVAGAKAAFPAWRDLSPTQRGKYFHKLASLIREHEQEFARLEALSSGKPVSRYIDASVAADAFSYFAEAGWTVQGSSSWNTPGQLNITSREPYGVVAAIIPWNVPFAFFGIKIAPALAAGNTIVLKSSEKAPLTVSQSRKNSFRTLLLAELTVNSVPWEQY